MRITHKKYSYVVCDLGINKHGGDDWIERYKSNQH